VDHLCVVIAATNRIEDIDEAILRRFESKIYVGKPNAQERIEMIHKFLDNISHQLKQEDILEISQLTELWSGSEIENIIRDTCMKPIRKIFHTQNQSNYNNINNSNNNNNCFPSIIKLDPVTIQDFCKLTVNKLFLFIFMLIIHQFFLLQFYFIINVINNYR